MAAAALPARVEGWDFMAQPAQVVKVCNLCGNARFVVMSTRDRYGLQVETHGCVNCGLMFLNPLLTREAYAAFYAGPYRELVRAWGGNTAPRDPALMKKSQAWYAAELMGFMAPFKPRGGLLDVGGSTGVVARAFLDSLKLEAATVVDPAPDGDVSGVEFVRAGFEDYTSAREWDVVTMCQTVDHLHDFAGGLAKIHGLLKREGLFFVDFSDVRRSVKHFGGFRQVLKVDHPYYFVEETAEWALRRAGFEVLRKTYAMSPYHVGYVCRPLGHVGYVCRPLGEPLPAILPPDGAAILREVRP